MPTQRHFLGWNRSVTQTVRDFLIPDAITESVDLGDTFVIVPTRQASRRLRETLASHCAASSAAMLSANVNMPATLFRSRPHADYRETNGLVSQAIWADLLHNAPPSDFPALFPATQINRDVVWAERMAQTLQRLRETLADGGYTIQDVVMQHGEDIQELDRWRDLAEAEQRYLSRVKSLEYNDATLRKIQRAAAPVVPDGVTRIVVASVPDPSLLMIRALDALQKEFPVDILVMAPESHKDRFDDWGRPIPEAWRDRPITIPNASDSIILASTPKAQADRTIQAIAEAVGQFGPGDVAIGVPDRTVIPFLETTLTELGLPVFDPAEKYLKDHPIFGLLDAFVTLHTNRTYLALRDLVRHPDVLAWLQTKDIPTDDLLTALDKFQNEHLPLRLDDITSHLSQTTAHAPLPPASTAIHDLLQSFDKTPVADATRALLEKVYANRMISSKNIDDQAFAAAAAEVSEVLGEFAAYHDDIAPDDATATLRLLIQRLSEQTYHAERDDSRIDLEGWLELPWNDAPFMIATGMNEGRVPDGRLSDMFLPDSLRSQLGLRDDAGRLARDAYLMTLMIETRRTDGKTLFIVGKTSAAGDPLKPTRLLFRCEESELVARAEALFAPVEEHEPHHASTLSFKLDPLAPLAGKSPAGAVEKLSVTSFRSYLACPFRFYLRNILRMNPLDDCKRELDARDFGSLAHTALQKMGESDMWQHNDPDAIAAFLVDEVEKVVAQRFPYPPPLPVQIALDAARQRLRQAAHVQVTLTRAGWEMINTETHYQMQLGGLPLRGIIDRVDRHRDTGQLRIIDYKTSDSETSPIAAHLAPLRDDTPEFAQAEFAGKPRRWIDLQLPLYHMLLQTNGLLTDDAELAYFNLPKAVLQTGISPWEAWTPNLLTSARTCAEAVVKQIQDGIFWPPAPRVDYDDFESLFPATPEDCFEPINSEGQRTEDRDRIES